MTKVKRAEKSETLSADEVDDSGTEKTTTVPPGGALLWAEVGDRWDFRWGSEGDHEVLTGWVEEEEVGACCALLYMDAR